VSRPYSPRTTSPTRSTCPTPSSTSPAAPSSRGDKTFRCFEGNATDQAFVATDIGDSQIGGANLYGFGTEGFTDGIEVGAVNIMGLVYCKVGEVYVRGSTGWGAYLTNFQHIEVGTFRVLSCQHGVYLGALLPSATSYPATAWPGSCSSSPRTATAPPAASSWTRPGPTPSSARSTSSPCRSPRSTGSSCRPPPDWPRAAATVASSAHLSNSQTRSPQRAL